MIFTLGLAFATGTQGNGEIFAPQTQITLQDFSRDRTLFDSGQAVGRDTAEIPISGTATPGETIQLRVFSDSETLIDWQDVALADASGAWSASFGLGVQSEWLRVSVRNKSEPMTRATAANRVGIGHVIALWGQSELVRLRAPGFDALTPEPLLDQDAVQVMWFDGAPVLRHLSDADPVTSSLAAMANVLVSERPGEKFAIVFHAVSGSGFTALVDDGDPARSWDDEVALHSFATADGQHVGLPAVSWFAAPGALGENYDDALLPIFTGRDISGATVSFPTTLTWGTQGSVQADHWFGELYDTAHTRWVPYGPHRFDIPADMQNATRLADGTLLQNLLNKQTSRLAWREMLAHPAAQDVFLPLGLEPLSYQNGVTDGAGGWADHAHPAADSDDGAPMLARLTAHAILQSSGLVNWSVPEFDSAEWEPSGAYVEIWSSAGPITTLRASRGLAPLDDSFAHWTQVLGWQINGAPAERAELVNGRVRLYPLSGAFVASDVITYGEGGASGMLVYGTDHIAGTYQDLPIVDTGAARVAGIAVRPLPSPEVLDSTLSAQEVSYTTSETGPFFVDPLAIGAGVGQVSLRLNFSMALPSSARTLLSLTGNFIKLDLLPSGTLRLRIRDAAGVVHISNVGSTSGAITSNARADLVFSVDLAAGFARIWVDGALVLDRSFSSTQPEFPSARKFTTLALSNGNGQIAAEVFELDLWKSATPDGAAPTGPVYKSLTGTAGQINADLWKLGGDAS